jgi:CheY-like chemotaxis protein
MNELKKILIAEDDPKDAELMMLALEESKIANNIVLVNDGAEALDYFYRRGKFSEREKKNPIVAFLDLKMPKVDGLTVAREIKSNVNLKTIPLVIVTSSREEKDLVESYNIGVNAYVVKPVEFDKFIETVKQLGIFWALINEPPV